MRAPVGAKKANKTITKCKEQKTQKTANKLM